MCQDPQFLQNSAIQFSIFIGRLLYIPIRTAKRLWTQQSLVPQGSQGSLISLLLIFSLVFYIFTNTTTYLWWRYVSVQFSGSQKCLFCRHRTPQDSTAGPCRVSSLKAESFVEKLFSTQICLPLRMLLAGSRAHWTHAAHPILKLSPTNHQGPQKGGRYLQRSGTSELSKLCGLWEEGGGSGELCIQHFPSLSCSICRSSNPSLRSTIQKSWLCYSSVPNRL